VDKSTPRKYTRWILVLVLIVIVSGVVSVNIMLNLTGSHHTLWILATPLAAFLMGALVHEKVIK